MSDRSICPRCGAQLQEGARFCPHCMTSFEEKQHISKPKAPISKRKNVMKALICCVLAVAVIIGGSIGIFQYKKHSPICTFSTFTQAILLTSERMGIDDLWDTDGFKNLMLYENDNTVRYGTKTHINGINLSLFFYNKGERISAYITDVKSDDIDNCKKMLMCIVQAVCNDYFSDLQDIFNDRTVYPFIESNSKFDTDFTDFLQLTDKYNEDISNGAKFKSEYIDAYYKAKKIYIQYAQTARQYSNEILYDLSVTIEK